jgi:hypothetical protein
MNEPKVESAMIAYSLEDGMWWATNSGDFGLIAAHEDREQLRENVRIAITDCFGEEVEITEIFDNQDPKTQLIH